MAFIDLTYTEIVGNDLKRLDKDFKVESGWEKIWKCSWITQPIGYFKELIGQGLVVFD